MKYINPHLVDQFINILGLSNDAHLQENAPVLAGKNLDVVQPMGYLQHVLKQKLE